MDGKTSELEQSISDKTQQRNNIEKKYLTVSEFLRESEFGSMVSLDDEIELTDNQIDSLREQITQLNSRAMADNEVYRAIKSTLSEIELDKKATQLRLSENERKVERFTRLKNDYLNDIEKFNSSLEAREIIGEVSEEISLCPICDNTLQLESAKKKFEIAPTEKVKHEINSLRRRFKDTEVLINESKRQWEQEKSRLQEINEQELKARELIDKILKI